MKGPMARRLMSHGLFLQGTASLLAGCLSGGGPDPSEGLQPSESPQPVAIEETVDLLQSVDGKSWDFSIAPDARDVVIRFAVQGRDSQAWVGRSICLTYHVDSAGGDDEGSVGQCPSSNVVVQSPPVGVEEKVMLEWDGSTAGPGNYSFSIRADPQPADLHVSVTIAY